MSDKKLHLKITTHEKVVFNDDVDEIYLKGIQGEFGILPGHIPFMSALDIGVAKIVKNGHVNKFTVMGGVFQLIGNEALILTQTAESADEIDIARAEAAKARAKERLEEYSDTTIDINRAEVALAKAFARLKATGKG